MKHPHSLLTVIVALALVALAHAAIPNMKPEELQKRAEHIVTAKVQAIYTRETKDDQWRRVVGVVELAVTGVEKGQGIKQGDVVHARYWNTAWIGKGNPPPYGRGHTVPQEGAEVRAFLKHKDGVYEPLLPNGLAPLEAQP